MLTALVVLAVLGILVGAAVLATHDGDVLRDPLPDDRDEVLPPGAVQPEDVHELRFDLAVRGYRMSQVDAAMQRLASELVARDTRIAELERALVDLPEPAPLASVEVEAPAADVDRTQEEPAPGASAEVEAPAADLERTQEATSAEVAPATGAEGMTQETYEAIEPASVAPATISGPLTATTWFTEPAPVPAAEDVPPDLASADVDPPAEEPERTQEQEALTLPAADDAVSFPELHPPEPAADEEPPDRWSNARERED